MRICYVVHTDLGAVFFALAAGGCHGVAEHRFPCYGRWTHAVLYMAIGTRLNLLQVNSVPNLQYFILPSVYEGLGPGGADDADPWGQKQRRPSAATAPPEGWGGLAIFNFSVEYQRTTKTEHCACCAI